MEEKRPAPFPLRMPEEMRNSLEGHAKQDGRSLNAEIVHRLKRSLDMNEVADLASKAERMGDHADAVNTTMEKLHSIMHELETSLKELEAERDYHRRQQTNHEDLVIRKYNEQFERDD